MAEKQISPSSGLTLIFHSDPNFPKCLRHPERTLTRQVVFFTGRAAGKPETFTAKMKTKIDSLTGRYIYSQRLGTVEPVFANITRTLGLNRLRYGANGK